MNYKKGAVIVAVAALVIVYACGRSRVAKQHFEGAYDLGGINEAMRHPIEIIHLAEFEEEASAVISDWGKTSGQSA
jgi:hypothetical protein